MTTKEMSNEEYARHMREKRGVLPVPDGENWDVIYGDNIRLKLGLSDKKAALVPSWILRIGVADQHPWYAKAATDVGLVGWITSRSEDSAEDRWWFTNPYSGEREGAIAYLTRIGDMAQDAIPKAKSEGIATKATTTTEQSFEDKLRNMIPELNR